jgi:YegS/Rv2252/BmrU family lipid kinase
MLYGRKPIGFRPSGRQRERVPGRRVSGTDSDRKTLPVFDMPDSWGARRLLVVVNRRSRSGATAPDAMFARLEQAGLTLLVEECGPGVDLSDLIRRLRHEVQAVVLGGGDGTLNAAAAGLLETGLPLGILPLGTANDLARTLGLPEDPVEAAGVIASGHRRFIDLGEVNGKYFFNVASLGLSVDLTRALTRDLKRRWGKLGYAVAALKALSRARHFSAEIRAGDRRLQVRSVQIAVGNGRHYGSGMTVSEDTEIDDARLDVYSLEPRRLWTLALLLPAMRRGSHGEHEEVRTLTGAEFEIRTRWPRPINTDGELTTQTPARFSVHPRAIAVFVPTPDIPWAGLEQFDPVRSDRRFDVKR